MKMVLLDAAQKNYVAAVEAKLSKARSRGTFQVELDRMQSDFDKQVLVAKATHDDVRADTTSTAWASQAAQGTAAMPRTSVSLCLRIQTLLTSSMLLRGCYLGT